MKKTTLKTAFFAILAAFAISGSAAAPPEEKVPGRMTVSRADGTLTSREQEKFCRELRRVIFRFFRIRESSVRGTLDVCISPDNEVPVEVLRKDRSYTLHWDGRIPDNGASRRSFIAGFLAWALDLDVRLCRDQLPDWVIAGIGDRLDVELRDRGPSKGNRDFAGLRLLLLDWGMPDLKALRKMSMERLPTEGQWLFSSVSRFLLEWLYSLGDVSENALVQYVRCNAEKEGDEAKAWAGACAPLLARAQQRYYQLEYAPCELPPEDQREKVFCKAAAESVAFSRMYPRSAASALALYQEVVRGQYAEKDDAVPGGKTLSCFLWELPELSGRKDFDEILRRSCAGLHRLTDQCALDVAMASRKLEQILMRDVRLDKAIACARIRQAAEAVEEQIRRQSDVEFFLQDVEKHVMPSFYRIAPSAAVAAEEETAAWSGVEEFLKETERRYLER